MRRLVPTALGMALLLCSCQLAPNRSPAIVSLEAEPRVVLPGESCQVSCVAFDADDDELSYIWWASNGQIQGNDALVNWTAPESEGIYSISVTVNDGRGGEATGHVVVTVKANRPPEIAVLSSNTDWVSPQDSVQLICEAEDPDGDELSYQWMPAAGNISGQGSQVTWRSPETPGRYDIAVTVTDAHGATDARVITITVAPDTPPAIRDLIVTADHKYFKRGTGSYRIGKKMDCQIECLASSSWGSELVFTWSATGGQILGEGSKVTWTAPDVSGKFTVTVTVSDIAGNALTKSIVFEVVACSPCEFG